MQVGGHFYLGVGALVLTGALPFVSYVIVRRKMWQPWGYLMLALLQLWVIYEYTVQLQGQEDLRVRNLAMVFGLKSILTYYLLIIGGLGQRRMLARSIFFVMAAVALGEAGAHILATTNFYYGDIVQ